MAEASGTSSGASGPSESQEIELCCSTIIEKPNIFFVIFVNYCNNLCVVMQENF